MMENEKVCESCGRPFSSRKKSKDNFEDIKYCSKSCQKNKAPIRFQILILEELKLYKKHERLSLESLILKSENPNAVKERFKAATRLLANKGLITIYQRNKKIKNLNFRGDVDIGYS